ncbi:MAG: hypothetical protein QM689_09495 [Oscillospiraceae bacterium]
MNNQKSDARAVILHTCAAVAFLWEVSSFAPPTRLGAGIYAMMGIACVAALFLARVLFVAGRVLFMISGGWKLLMLRFDNRYFLRQNGKLTVIKSFPGDRYYALTMQPPPFPEAKHLTTGYVYGGFVTAGLAALCAGGGAALTAGFARLFLLVFATAGFCTLLAELIVYKLPLKANAATVASQCRNSRAARRCFHTMYAADAALFTGTRLRDMSEEWFTLPENPDYNQVLTYECAKVRASFLMDKHAFEEAEELLTALLGITEQIKGLPAPDLRRDLIYLACIRGDITGAQALATPAFRTAAQQFKHIPAWARAEYALLLFTEHRDNRLGGGYETFLRRFAKYPYRAATASEYELVTLAGALYAAENPDAEEE